MFQLVTPRRAYQVRAPCGRRIGMCGYTLVPEDGRDCYILTHFVVLLICRLVLLARLARLKQLDGDAVNVDESSDECDDEDETDDDVSAASATASQRKLSGTKLIRRV